MCHSPQILGLCTEATNENASYDGGFIFTSLNGLPSHSTESMRQL